MNINNDVKNLYIAMEGYRKGNNIWLGLQYKIMTEFKQKEHMKMAYRMDMEYFISRLILMKEDLN